MPVTKQHDFGHLDFLHKFDCKMEKEKLKVILFMNQCPAHPKDLLSLNYTKVMFFPANHFPSNFTALERTLVGSVLNALRSPILKLLG